MSGNLDNIRNKNKNNNVIDLDYGVNSSLHNCK